MLCTLLKVHDSFTLFNCWLQPAKAFLLISTYLPRQVLRRFLRLREITYRRPRLRRHSGRDRSNLVLRLHRHRVRSRVHSRRQPPTNLSHPSRRTRMVFRREHKPDIRIRNRRRNPFFHRTNLHSRRHRNRPAVQPYHRTNRPARKRRNNLPDRVHSHHLLSPPVRQDLNYHHQVQRALDLHRHSLPALKNRSRHLSHQFLLDRDQNLNNLLNRLLLQVRQPREHRTATPLTLVTAKSVIHLIYTRSTYNVPKT